MTTTAEKLPVREKVGYALGDTAANFIFQTMAMFQLAFYTDTFGITVAAAGTLIVVVRVWDAIFDPVMGYWSNGVDRIDCVFTVCDGAGILRYRAVHKLLFVK